MPLLTYSAPSFPFTAFTKIISADVNTMFTDIRTLLNTTGLDNTNIQNAGINPLTKLSLSGGTLGQFLSNNGSAVIWASNPLTTQFNVVFGSAAQVTAGTATHSTFSSWTQTAGDRVLILPGYNETANWSLSVANLYIVAMGRGATITGTLTFTSGADYCLWFGGKITDNITINSGADGVEMYGFVQANGKTATNNGTASVAFGVRE